MRNKNAKVYALMKNDTQLAIAEKFGMGAETVARWLRAPEFPERRIRSDRSEIERAFSRTRSGVCIRPWLEVISPPAGSPLSC
jgi:hypothetical protein